MMENCGIKICHTRKHSEDPCQSQKHVDSEHVKTESDEDPIWACYTSLDKQGDSEASGVKTEPLWVKSEAPEHDVTGFTSCENLFSVPCDQNVVLTGKQTEDSAVLGQTVGIKNEDHIWESFWDCYNSVPGYENQRTGIDIKQENLTIKQECCEAPNLLSATELQPILSPVVRLAPKKNIQRIGNLQNETSKLSNPKDISRQGIGSDSQVKVLNQQARPLVKSPHIAHESFTPPKIFPANKLSQSSLRPTQVHRQPQSFKSILQQDSKAHQIISVQPVQLIPLSSNPVPNMTLTQVPQSAPNYTIPHQLQSSTTNQLHSPSPGHARAGENNVPQQGGMCLERSQQEKSLLDCFQFCQRCQKTLNSHYVEGGKHKSPKSTKATNKGKTRNWKCCQCDVALCTSGKLIYHLMKKHARATCAQCNMSFNNKKKLAYHLNCKHEPPVSCEECGKVCRSRYHLKNHQRSHNEELIKHFCELCGKGFKLRSGLQMHMTVHTTERPYECPDCKATFKADFHLVKHRLKHTDLKPFSCHVCQNKFKTKASLQAHLKTHNKGPMTKQARGKERQGHKTKKVQLSESEEDEEWEEESEEEESDEDCEEEDAE